VALRDQRDESSDADGTTRKPAKRRESCVFPVKTEILPTGIEPVTFSSGGGSTGVVSAENKALTASPAERCTTGCTESPSKVEILARAVELVAAMRLPVEEATAVLEAIVGGSVAG